MKQQQITRGRLVLIGGFLEMQRAQIVVVGQRDAVEHVVAAAVETGRESREFVEVAEGHFAAGDDAPIAAGAFAQHVLHAAFHVLGQVAAAIRIAPQFLLVINRGRIAVDFVEFARAFRQHRAVGLQPQFARAIRRKFKRDAVRHAPLAGTRDDLGQLHPAALRLFVEQPVVQSAPGGAAEFSQFLDRRISDGLVGVHGLFDGLFDGWIGHKIGTRFLRANHDAAQAGQQHTTQRHGPMPAQLHLDLSQASIIGCHHIDFRRRCMALLTQKVRNLQLDESVNFRAHGRSCRADL